MGRDLLHSLGWRYCICGAHYVGVRLCCVHPPSVNSVRHLIIFGSLDQTVREVSLKHVLPTATNYSRWTGVSLHSARNSTPMLHLLFTVIRLPNVSTDAYIIPTSTKRSQRSRARHLSSTVALVVVIRMPSDSDHWRQHGHRVSHIQESTPIIAEDRVVGAFQVSLDTSIQR